jgi:N-acetylmuramoyl-L-alanine amidase
LESAVIWDAAENADLRSKRKDPHQLLPGDKVFIPEVKPRTYTLATGQRHRLQVPRDKLMLRLQVLDIFGKPLASASGTLRVGERELPVTSAADGTIEVKDIPQQAREATLEIGGYTFELRIGDLDPADCPTGESARLDNLALWWADTDDPEDPEGQAFALDLFQQGRQEAPGSQDATVEQRLRR